MNWPHGLNKINRTKSHSNGRRRFIFCFAFTSTAAFDRRLWQKMHWTVVKGGSSANWLCNQRPFQNARTFDFDKMLPNRILLFASQPSLNFHQDFYRNSSYDNECSNAAESRKHTCLWLMSNSFSHHRIGEHCHSFLMNVSSKVCAVRPLHTFDIFAHVHFTAFFEPNWMHCNSWQSRH